jgi:hypothetical protein
MTDSMPHALEARTAWLAVWRTLPMPAGHRFSHAHPMGSAPSMPMWRTGAGPHTHGRASKVHWLFLDHRRVVHAASAPGHPGCLGSALQAAKEAVLITVGMPGTQHCMSAATGLMSIPSPERERLSEACRNHNQQAAAQLEGELIAMHMASFVALLDPDAVQTAQAMRRKKIKRTPPVIAQYNVYAGGGANANVDQAPGWRRQAATAFPMFAGDIGRVESVACAIDGSSPLVDAIARARGLRPLTVRALAGWPMGEGVRPGRFHSIVALADVLPPDWLPRDPAGWASLRTYVPLLLAMGLLRHVTQPACPAQPGLDAGARPDMTARRHMLQDVVRRAGRDFEAAAKMEPGLRAATAHIADTGSALCLEVVLPELVSAGYLAAKWIEGGMDMREDMRSFGGDLIVSGRTPRMALRVSAAHLGRHVATAPAQQDARSSWWMPLAEDAQAPNGLQIVNLSTSEDLDAEGKSMSHCVSSYSWQCHDGACRIVSVRSKDGTASLSTAEIRVSSTGRCSVAQHRAHENASPGRAPCDALEWYMDALRQGTIACNVKELAALQRQREALSGYAHHIPPEEFLDAAAAYPWREAEARAVVWKRWARILGVRADTAAAWLASCPDFVLDAEGGSPMRAAVKKMATESALQSAA